MSDMKTINLQGKQYAQVKDRVRAFHEKNANGSIVTNWFTAFDEEKILCFKATVIPDVENEDRFFTGHAMGGLKQVKSFEKLETIAVGRALANAGFLSDGEIASADEMENFLSGSGLPDEIAHLVGRYPFDKTLKTPKDSHKPYLNDGSEELNNVESDVYNGIVEPRFLSYFYTVNNRVLEYLHSVYVKQQTDSMQV